jgi:hypothetical protein
VSDDRLLTELGRQEAELYGETDVEEFVKWFQPIVAACTEKCNEHTHETRHEAQDTTAQASRRHYFAFLVMSSGRPIYVHVAGEIRQTKRFPWDQNDLSSMAKSGLCPVARLG